MATADVTYQQFIAEVGAAKTATAAGDFSAARVQIALATQSLAGLMQAQSTDGRSYNLASLKDFLKQSEDAIDLAERAAQGAGDIRIVVAGFGRAR